MRIGNAAHAAVPARRVRRGARRAAPGPSRRASPTPTAPGRSRPRWSSVVEDRWREPDDGIWEVRGGRQHFTHSKVMAWVALDRAIRSADPLRPRGAGRPLARRVRRDPRRGARPAASTTAACSCSPTARRPSTRRRSMIPLVGFLPPDDERVVATVEAIDRELDRGRLRAPLPPGPRGRRRPAGRRGRVPHVHVLDGRLPRASWAAGTRRPARFERLLALRNDVGLLAEQYDPIGAAHARQLPPGLQPRLAGLHRRDPATAPQRPTEQRPYPAGRRRCRRRP